MNLFQYGGALVAKCPGTNMAGHHRTAKKGPVSMLRRVRALLATRGETTLHRWFYCCSSVYVIKLGVDKVICRTIMFNNVHVLLVPSKPCADHAISTGSGIINPRPSWHVFWLLSRLHRRLNPKKYIDNKAVMLGVLDLAFQ